MPQTARVKFSERSTARQAELVREIRRLHAQRQPLNLAAVKKRHPELIREVFAIRPFWGWIQALRHAGLDYASINTELDEIIDCRICGRSFQRLQNHLKKHGISAAAYREKYQAETHSELERARDQSRTYSRHRHQDRLPMWDSPWCEEIVLDRMAEYHRQRVPLHYSEMEKREYPLVSRTCLYFGSWDAALRRIGLDPAQVRRRSSLGAVHYPTASSVVRAIRRRHKKVLPLNSSALTQTLRSHPHRDEPLFDRGVHFFGSWDEAIRQAGLPRQRLVRRPCYTTPEAVLEEIQRRQRQRKPLHALALTAGSKAERDRILYRYGARFFGSWNQAVAQAGLPLQALRVRGGRYPTGPTVIAEIQRRTQAGLPIHNYQLHTGPNKDAALLKCGTRHFGTWAKALQAAHVASPYRKLGPLILQALQAAGSNGLTEKEIAIRIAGNQVSVHGWLYQAGRKVAGLQKIAPATYAYTPDQRS